MSESMVELVAVALVAKIGWGESGDLRDMPPEIREQWLDRSRAAIEAMREPTGAMKTAGREHVFACSDSWRAMIDAALSGKVDA